MNNRISFIAAISMAANSMFAATNVQAQSANSLPAAFTEENIGACLAKAASKPDRTFGNQPHFYDEATVGGLTCTHKRDNSDCYVETIERNRLGTSMALLWLRKDEITLSYVDSNERVVQFNSHNTGYNLKVFKLGNAAGYTYFVTPQHPKPF